MANPSNPVFPRPSRASREAAQRSLKGPAIGLIAVSALSLFLALLTIVWDTILLMSGSDNFDDLPLGSSSFAFKTIWGLVLVASNGFSLFGGVQMLRLQQQQHQLCWLAAVLACIPVIGPCFCLGIPFGVWAIIVLNRSDVTKAFD